MQLWCWCILENGYCYWKWGLWCWNGLLVGVDWVLSARGGGGQWAAVVGFLLPIVGWDSMGTELYEEWGACCCDAIKGDECLGIILGDEKIVGLGL